MTLLNLKGKKAFVAGIGDDNGFGWAIAKALHSAGCSIIVGTWTPMVKIFTTALEAGKFDTSRRHDDGSMMEFLAIYPIDASFDKPEDVPEEIRSNKRYKDVGEYTISDVAARIERDHGKIDFVIHSLANGPEVQKPLLETSRNGYMAAVSSSAYSFVSMVAHFAPRMYQGGGFVNLTYLASERVIPGYGGGMSSAKAALESDTRVLAYEVGARYGLRVNAISAGPYASRAAKAIGFIENMIEYSRANSPLRAAIEGEDVGNTALFLLSNLARGITGEVIHVDAGMHVMGASLDSPAFPKKA